MHISCANYFGPFGNLIPSRSDCNLLRVIFKFSEVVIEREYTEAGRGEGGRGGLRLG